MANLELRANKAASATLLENISKLTPPPPPDFNVIHQFLECSMFCSPRCVIYDKEYVPSLVEETMFVACREEQASRIRELVVVTRFMTIAQQRNYCSRLIW